MAFWSEFLEACSHTENVSIICRDGILRSHKIVLANVSKFMENILKDIPSGDEATIFLTDISKTDIEPFLQNAASNKSNHQQDLDSNLSTLFGVQHYINSNFKHELNDEKLVSIICKQEHFEEEEEFDSLESTSDNTSNIETPKLIKIKPKVKAKKSKVRKMGRDINEIEAIRAKYNQAINAFKRYSGS